MLTSVPVLSVFFSSSFFRFFTRFWLCVLWCCVACVCCCVHVFWDLRVVPFVVRGAFRGAMRLAFEEILEGHEVNSNTRMSRGWKLLMLLPRMLLHRPSRGGRISRKQLEERFRRFQEGVVEFAPLF